MLDRRGLLISSMLLATGPAWAAGGVGTLVNPGSEVPWPTALLMGTGRPGGSYALYGPAWGSLAQNATGVSIAYMASGGAADDILLIEQGAAQLGMTVVAVADQARSGTGAWTAGVKFNSFRALFPIFPSILQIVTPAGSAIGSVAELTGRVIGVGPEGGSGPATLPGILSSIGVTPANCIPGDYMPQIGDMLGGRLDACAFMSAPPVPAIQLAAQHHRLELIGFTPEETLQVTKAWPSVSAMVLPPGTFQNQWAPLTSLGTGNFAIGAASLPNNLVAALTLAALRHRDKLAAVVPAAAMSPIPLLGGQGEMSFHPGAALALRSLGMDVPAKFVED